MKPKAAATSTIPASARASTLPWSNPSARSKKPRALGQQVRAKAAIEHGQALKVEVYGIRIGRFLGAARLGTDELGLKLVREPGDDLILHVKKVCDRFVETLGPNVIASFSVDQLRVDANTIAAALHTAFEDVAHVELASDLLHVRGLAFVGERRVACDDQSASYA